MYIYIERERCMYIYIYIYICIYTCASLEGLVGLAARHSCAGAPVAVGELVCARIYMYIYIYICIQTYL